jgi:hypothetical protein
LPEHDKVEEDGPRRSEQPRGVDHDVLCARAGEEDRLQRDAPWLLGSAGTIFLDFIVLGQFAYYAKERRLEQARNEEDRLQRVGVSSRTHRRLRLKKTHGNVGGVTADNAPWLLGSAGTIFLDFIVLGQFAYYAKERRLEQ